MRSMRVILSAMRIVVLLVQAPAVLVAGELGENREGVASEEYAIYNRIVESKFLTSDTSMVLIDELTAIRLGPSGPPFSREWFEENQVFDGRVTRALVADFLIKTQEPSRLAAKFDFGV